MKKLSPFFKNTSNIDLFAGLRCLENSSVIELEFEVHEGKNFALSEKWELWRSYQSLGSFQKNQWNILGQDLRRNELWKSICFEGFFCFHRSEAEKSLQNRPYFEFNFSPLGFWNLYSFQSYRSGMLQEDRLDSVAVIFERSDSAHSKMLIQIDFSFLFASVHPIEKIKGQAGLTAVFGANEQFDFWALDHFQDRPDFHDQKSFTYNF